MPDSESSQPQLALINTKAEPKDAAKGTSPLPPVPPWLLENIAEASKKASRIYTIFIGLLAYCALTVVSTTDKQLILNEPARLPVVNIEVNLVGFFILSPILALVVFVYLQLYLHRIKSLVNKLGTQYAKMEQGSLYPWMLNIAEDPEPGGIGKLQKGIVAASLWWSMPIILFLFPLWYMKTHDPARSYLVGAIPLVGLWIVLWFWRRYEPGRKWGRKAFSIFGALLMVTILANIHRVQHGTVPAFNLDLHRKFYLRNRRQIIKRFTGLTCREKIYREPTFAVRC